MILNDLIDLMTKDKRKRERAEAAQRFAVGMGVVATVGVAAGILLAPKSGKETREYMKEKVKIAVDSIRDTVHKRVELLKDSAARAVEDISNEIKVAYRKTEAVKKDVKDGCDLINL